jgi:hypothetical protein
MCNSITDRLITNCSNSASRRTTIPRLVSGLTSVNANYAQTVAIPSPNLFAGVSPASRSSRGTGAERLRSTNQRHGDSVVLIEQRQLLCMQRLSL